METTLGKGEVGVSITPRGTIAFPPILGGIATSSNNFAVFLLRSFVKEIAEHCINVSFKTGNTWAICSRVVRAEASA